MPKSLVNFFISYASQDRRTASKLLNLLQTQLAASTNYNFQLWADAEILPGETWRMEIANAIEHSDLGLLLVSPAFLDSEFITAEELPRFVGHQSKPAIPVAVQPVDLATGDLKGLEDHQIFRLDRSKPFATCTGNARSRFAEQLYHHIERRLNRLEFRGADR